MVNIGPQRENINNTVELLNASLEASRLPEPELFDKLEKTNINEELKQTRKLQQKAREYRKDKLYEMEEKPLKTGPTRIIRFQLHTLEEELAEHQLRLQEQDQIQN